jgi:hypothetical protein
MRRCIETIRRVCLDNLLLQANDRPGNPGHIVIRTTFQQMQHIIVPTYLPMRALHIPLRIASEDGASVTPHCARVLYVISYAVSLPIYRPKGDGHIVDC